MEFKIPIYICLIRVFSIDCTNYTMQESNVGGKVIFRCPFKAKNTSIQWFRIDKQTIYANGPKINPALENKKSVKIEGSHEDGEFYLSLWSLRKQDEGTYRCALHVDGNVKFKEFSLKVLENSDVSTENSTTQKQSISGFQLNQFLGIYMIVILCIHGSPLLVAFLANKYSQQRSRKIQTRQNLAVQVRHLPYHDLSESPSITLERHNVTMHYDIVDFQTPNGETSTISQGNDLRLENTEHSNLYQELEINRNNALHLYEGLHC